MFKKKNEKGQTIILIAVAIFGLIAMAALIVDGGNAYLNRRAAQTAADSAALAAAYEKCVNHVVDLQPIVDEYATNQNDADRANWSFSPPDSDYPKGKITVITEIDVPTFFARVLFDDSVLVKAKASVGCFLPADANKILPIAWTCRQHEGTVDSCVINTIPVNLFDELVATNGQAWFEDYLLDVGDGVTSASYMTDYLNDPPLEGKPIYLVMDDDSFMPELDCEELNTATDATPGVGLINCDFDNDDIIDVEGGAERGWLQLDDGGGAVDLWTVMLYGFDGVLELPQWFPANTGVINSVFINAHQIKFRKNLIPVYNAICEDTTEETLTADCWEDYVGGDLIRQSDGNQTYHRVPGIAVFVVTCVSKGVPEPCPGKTLSGVAKNTSTIEGYFLEGYVAGTKISNSGFDLGVYVLSLIE